MLSSSLNRLNRTSRLITVDDISDSVLAGRSAAHTACWKYLQASSYDSALDHAEQIIKREPEKPDGYVFKARALFKKSRFQEAEETLLKVMKIAEESDLIRSDVEGMIKLKDELANSRVEILRSRNFREPIDIAEMHWNDCQKPILELIGFATHYSTQSRGNTANTGPKTGDKATPMDVDFEIIDIIGAERAKQLYPELMINSAPKHQSTPNSSNGYSKRRSVGFSNLDLTSDFPSRDKDNRVSDPKPDQKANTSRSGGDVSDNELRTAGLKTALLLAEEKNGKYERKVQTLEQELREVYQHLIKLNDEKKTLQKKCDTLVNQLDKVVGKGSTLAKQDRDDDIQVLRQVVPNPAFNRRRKPILRNPYIPPWKSSILPRPFKDIPKVKESDKYKTLPKQRPMVFTNSNRGSQLIRDALKDQSLNKSGPPYSRLRTPLLEQTLEFNQLLNSSVTNASRRSYPPGILPAPSYLSNNEPFREPFHYRFRDHQ